MKKTKIDWCDCTVNPVVGCTNGCPYCYAERMNERFHFVKEWTSPEFFPERLKQFDHKKPKSVFINSMSDIGNWHQKWFEEVCLSIANNPQHNYIALTKTNAKCLMTRFLHCQGSIGKKLNVFIGKTVTRQEDVEELCENSEFTDFISIEPILNPIKLGKSLHTTFFVIIGAETGNSTTKVVPEKKWIDDIVKECKIYERKIFMKESLRELMKEDFIQDELPWAIK